MSENTDERQSIGYLKLEPEDAEALREAAREDDRSLIGQAIHYIREGLRARKKTK